MHIPMIIIDQSLCWKNKRDREGEGEGEGKGRTGGRGELFSSSSFSKFYSVASVLSFSVQGYSKSDSFNHASSGPII